ncbi:hypothetical protein GQ464_002225 [Rhodocaloribacter litoris]|uniref:hypothetical protein n=1 Tax=Rhodocaloribacter litoris TaxID=2558931 RepID=UPI001420C27C|nr:hypothetical protein [Rhodocaloribacter litoris]QXD15786.1 hypothetical protein GQ464_002225 [Rhodocaloribacter litoris]
MIANRKPCWMDGTLVPFDEYLRRVEAARARAEALCLTRTWIAAQIGRSRGHTTRVLAGRDRGVETLLRIEALLRRVEAGEVAPR